jgi:hypothetical protein
VLVNAKLSKFWAWLKSVFALPHEESDDDRNWRDW